MGYQLLARSSIIWFETRIFIHVLLPWGAWSGDACGSWIWIDVILGELVITVVSWSGKQPDFLMFFDNEPFMVWEHGRLCV